ncbi:pilin [Photobacterium kishitanii]|uniref:Pilus assembly protein PilA n=1 Tax=Photobacterium kishitanii TaxID=318456 RepID=A0A2T3KDU6_9GAMM|nr:prepilin-type N-terminal cleavage/methylation domain-containing protein [Photobacterium kishitanii]PSU94774.1 pilus assembly protein PilA [Photobacterium kishitanii]
MNKQQGFTLIELMIVVAIIGVLSAIAVPAYKNYVAKSEMASAMATMKALITPAELAMQSEGDLSGGLSTLGISAGANTLGDISIAAGNKGVVFTFDGGSLNGKTITFNRNDSGWACSRSDTTNMPEVEGCN